MTAEEIWRRKSDDDLRAAAERLDEYTEEGRRIIRAELERRSTPDYLIEQEALERQIVEATRERAPVRPIQRHPATWLVQRAVLAIALMIGFYLLAVAIALGLLWIPYAEVVYLHRIDKIALGSLGFGLIILWTLVPRADDFEPPGPRLDESVQPGLFRVIREVAAATRQAEPADVYLLNDVNAWVAHRGGTMGFGSRRVMGIGLPLLQALSVAEFKAIIAHEFGHYSSGDLKIGPWIHKTRAAIGRTIESVYGTLLDAPFQWYGRLFLRLTHAVSRRQEFIADQIAARVAGADNLASALRRVTALTPAYSSYLNEEVLPVLQSGFLPPVVDGFNEYLKTERISDATRRFVEEVEGGGQTNVFDTHPSLRDRLAALGATGDASPETSDVEPASVLIEDADAYVRPLLHVLFGFDRVDNLKPIDWSLVAESVFAGRWRAIAKTCSKWLAQFTADGIPSGSSEFARIGKGLVGSDEHDVTNADIEARATYVLGVGIGTVLLDRGWKPRTRPGMPMELVCGSDTFDPVTAVRALADGIVGTDAWKARCLELGIAGLPLGDPPALP